MVFNLHVVLVICLSSWYGAVPTPNTELPLRSNRIELNEFGLVGSEFKRNCGVTLFITYDLKTNELELELLLELDIFLVIHVEVSDTSLVLIHVLVDFEEISILRMFSLGLITFGNTEVLQSTCTVNHCLHPISGSH